MVGLGSGLGSSSLVRGVSLFVLVSGLVFGSWSWGGRCVSEEGGCSPPPCLGRDVKELGKSVRVSWIQA